MSERILVLCAAGMLGHKLVQLLAGRFTTFGAIRQPHALNSAAARAAIETAQRGH